MTLLFLLCRAKSQAVPIVFIAADLGGLLPDADEDMDHQIERVLDDLEENRPIWSATCTWSGCVIETRPCSAKS